MLHQVLFLSRQAKPGGGGRCESIETSRSHPVGSQSHPVERSQQPEASLAPVRGRPRRRSVDSDRRSRVIEPRKESIVGAFVVRSAGAVPECRIRLGTTARPGSESRADAERVAQEPGRARCVHDRRAGGTPANQSPGRCGTALGNAAEQSSGCGHGIAKRRQRSAARRAASSLSAPIVPRKRGNGGRTGPGGGKEGVKWQNRCRETRRMRWNLRTCQRNSSG